MRICDVDGCGGKHNAKGLCKKHYDISRNHGTPTPKTPIVTPNRNHNGTCSVDGCSAPYLSKSYCSAHYQRYLKHGDPLITKTPFRGQGWRKTAGGYIEVKIEPGHEYSSMAVGSGRNGKTLYILEHRLKMAEKLKRPLARWETVHHIDGNRENNAIENLQLRSSQHGQGVVVGCRDCGSLNIEYRSL